MISVALLSHATKSEIPVAVPHKALLYGVAVCFLWPAQAHCLSIGEAQLLSHFGQKLEARVPIELTTQSEIDDAAALSARIVPPTDQAADPGFPALASHALHVHLSGGPSRYVAELSSDDPISEPIAMLRLDVQTPHLRLLQEIPLIFDLAPAGSGGMIASQVAAPHPDHDSSTDSRAAPVTAPEVFITAAVSARVRQTVAHAGGSIERHAAIARSAAQRMRLQRFQLARSFDSYLALAATQAAAPAMGLKRFQLAQSFDSFETEAASAPAPGLAAPASGDDARSAAGTPMPQTAQSAARTTEAPLRPQPLPALPSRDSEFLNWRWWCIACLALLNLGLGYRRHSRLMANRAAASRPRMLPAPHTGPRFQGPTLARS